MTTLNGAASSVMRMACSSPARGRLGASVAAVLEEDVMSRSHGSGLRRRQHGPQR